MSGPADTVGDRTEQAVREMRRRPDAQMALEMIEGLTSDPNVHRVIAAYLEALDEA